MNDNIKKLLNSSRLEDFILGINLFNKLEDKASYIKTTSWGMNAIFIDDKPVVFKDRINIYSERTKTWYLTGGPSVWAVFMKGKPHLAHVYEIP